MAVLKPRNGHFERETVAQGLPARAEGIRLFAGQAGLSFPNPSISKGCSQKQFFSCDELQIPSADFENCNQGRWLWPLKL